MNINELFKDEIERIYNEIINERPKLINHSENELKYQFRKKIEKILNIIGDEIPLFFDENWVDVLIKDIVVETKKLNSLSGIKKINESKEQTKSYMKKYISPYGVLTDLNKIYFFEMKEDNTIIEEKRSELFNYDNFCYLVERIFSERKKFISEISLTTDFGYVTKNKLISKILKKLLALLKSSTSQKTQMIFFEWLKLFKLAKTTNKDYLSMRRKALENYFEVEINEDNEYLCIFTMHTLLSIIMKLLTYYFLTLINNYSITINSSIMQTIENLKSFYLNIEAGNSFKVLGIINYCQNDFFSWYLNEDWDIEMHDLLLSLNNRASLYKYLKIDPLYVKDAVQKLYENFIPREIRHSFGEYYTPSKISDYMLSEAKKFLNDKVSYRAIDPTCGSGTFLISLLKDKLSSRGQRNKNNSIKEIIWEVVGIDLNPIAVLMAKFNYLLTIYPILKEENDITDIEIPVYLGDSSYIPTEENINGITCLTYEYYFPNESNIKLPKIIFPIEFVKKTDFLPTLIEIEEMIEQNKSINEICKYLIDKIGEDLINNTIKKQINEIIKDIIEYQKKNLNTIWLFIFMNYLKPHALNKFDLIIGNPPWVRWSVLPLEYKEKIKRTLRDEGIFSKDTNYGGVDLNICALIAYRVIENLLDNNGLLAFIFPKGILNNKSYEGFRNFDFGSRKAELKLILKPIKSFFGEEPIMLYLKLLKRDDN